MPWALALMAALVVHAAAPSPARASGAVIQGLTGTTTPPNDDDWFESDLGFSIKFGDRYYSRIYISNNGFVIFEAPRYPWWYYWNWDGRIDTPGKTDGRVAVIAPYLKDVDTRDPGSGRVVYGQTLRGTRRAFFVTWNHVGYYDSSSDKLNTFQLLLIERSDRGIGDFDIVMNYDQIQWDHASDNSETTWSPTWYPRVGHYDGAGHTFELPGSRTDGLKDTSCPASGLACNTTNALLSVDGQPPGQYAYPLEDGAPPTGAVVAGTIYGPNHELASGAPVTLCRVSYPDPAVRAHCIIDATGCDTIQCDWTTLSDSQGRYTLPNVPAGDADSVFWLQVEPPPPTTEESKQWLGVVDTASFTITDAVLIADKDLTLRLPETVPAGTTLGPSAQNDAGIPVIYWGASTTLTTNGCVGGRAYYSVLDASGMPVRNRVEMSPMGTEGGLWHYVATVDALRPAHGDVTFEIELVCPTPDPVNCPGEGCTHSFSVYIDPSGTVMNTRGAPLTGARVTLLRANNPFGPFAPVPDGSPIMSPINRANPSYADATGHFGWDTIPGYYIVRAEKDGCVSPTDSARAYVETDVLPVPPAWLDLRLILDCDGTTPPVITAPAGLAAEADGPLGTAVSYQATAVDDVDGPVPVQCSPAPGSVFPLGITTVTCGASDAKGNLATVRFDIYVDDTTPPVITAPESLTATAASAAGSTVYYTAAAQDKVDGALTPTCSPTSGSLFPIGTTTVTCTAVDSSTNRARVSFPVTVAYAWTGVLSPLSNGGTYPLGRTIPVKFGLDGASAALPSITARLYVARVIHGGVGPESPAVSAGGANRGTFRYDAAEGLYIFNWSTQGLVAGTYQLRIDLGDGVLRTILIDLAGGGR